MVIDFLQGIVTYPTVGNAQSFLVNSGQHFTLSTANGHIDIAFAHGQGQYLLTETATVVNAWGPLPSNVDCWLYWDINTRTGIRTFGYTTLAPVYSASPPASPATGQMWFNPSLRKMYAYTGALTTHEVLRVFAAKVNNSTVTPLGTGYPSRPFAGTQVGLNVPGVPTGRILYDELGDPIRKLDGTFFTTESAIFSNGSPVNVIRLEASVLTATAREPLAKFNIVKYTEFGRVNVATYNDTGEYTIAIVLEDLGGEETGTVCLQGHITNPDWNWPDVGAKLWISPTGDLTNIDPHVQNAFVYPVAQVPVARVVSQTSVFFDQGLGGKGERGEPGLSGGVSLASTVSFGVSRLSVPAADVDNPIVVGSNDPRLDNKVLKAGDIMTGLLVLSGNPVVNLGAATKQYVDGAVSGGLGTVDMSSRVAKAGDTMTGFLTLNSDPTSNLHAATKQYVDDAIAGAVVIVPYDVTIACSNTTDELTNGTNVGYVVAARAATFTSVRADLLSPSTTGDVVIQITVNSVLNTTITITQNTITTATSIALSVSAGDRIGVNITSAGGGGVGLLIALIGTV